MGCVVRELKPARGAEAWLLAVLQIRLRSVEKAANLLAGCRFLLKRSALF